MHDSEFSDLSSKRNAAQKVGLANNLHRKLPLHLVVSVDFYPQLLVMTLYILY
jgi:hypothetical protein